jgi:hypothetical protein
MTAVSAAGYATQELMMSVTYAAFSESEHRERLARARKILRQNDIECCISVAPEHLYYFAGYDSWVSVNSPQALIFMADGGEPTLVVRDVDLALPRETSWVSDVRGYHLFSDDVPALIASVAREKGLANGKVGVETQSYALPYALGQALARALAPVAVVDTTDLVGATRLIKSPREMDYLRQAARYAQSGLDAARRALKPGITEIGLAAAVEGGMRGAGSDYWSIPTELASGPRTAGGHATARERVIESGDLVHLEFAGDRPEPRPGHHIQRTDARPEIRSWQGLRDAESDPQSRRQRDERSRRRAQTVVADRHHGADRDGPPRRKPWLPLAGLRLATDDGRRTNPRRAHSPFDDRTR